MFVKISDTQYNCKNYNQKIILKIYDETVNINNESLKLYNCNDNISHNHSTCVCLESHDCIYHIECLETLDEIAEALNCQFAEHLVYLYNVGSQKYIESERKVEQLSI